MKPFLVDGFTCVVNKSSYNPDTRHHLQTRFEKHNKKMKRSYIHKHLHPNWPLSIHINLMILSHCIELIINYI